MRRIVLAAIAILGLTACGQSEEERQHDPTWVQASAEVDVKEAMRDPDSAKITTTNVNPSARIVCGYVNSRNGFGGYSGDRAFVWTNGQVQMEENVGHRAMRKALATCTGAPNF